MKYTKGVSKTNFSDFGYEIEDASMKYFTLDFKNAKFYPTLHFVHTSQS